MAPRYEVNIELLGEIGHHLFIEHEAHTPLRFLVLLVLHLGVSPEEVAKQPLVGYVRWPLNHFDVPIVSKLLT